MGMSAGQIIVIYIDESGKEHRVSRDIDKRSHEAEFLVPIKTTDDSLAVALDHGHTKLYGSQEYYERLKRRSEMVESISNGIAHHLLSVISAKDTHNGYPKESAPINTAQRRN